MKTSFRKLVTATGVLRRAGLAGVRGKLAESRRRKKDDASYRKWLANNAISDADRDAMRTEIDAWPRRPKISVVMPVYDVGEVWLRKCLDSVTTQIYGSWELCIADDNSPSPHIREVLEEYAARDARVNIVFRTENGHISRASNSALELATGEFCVLLDHDDELSEDALFRVAEVIVSEPDVAFIYSDEDMIDESGRRYDPKFKPDFSRELFYSLNMITHLSAYRTEVLREIGGFRAGFEGSQDYDLALRVLERVGERRIRHIPRVLYHWRAIAGSVALSSDEKPYAHERAREALAEHLERTSQKASVARGLYQYHRVTHALPEPPPKVDVILWPGVTTASGLPETEYPNASFVRAKHSTAEYLNELAESTDGDLLCFLRGDLRPENSGWLGELASFAMHDEIGAASGKILDDRRRIWQAGIVFGPDGLAAAAHRGFSDESNGSLFRLGVMSNYSAVGLDCLCVRRDVFLASGGFDAANFPTSLFDFDFCLRLRERGLRIVVTPYSSFRGPRFDPRVTDSERAGFRERWRRVIEDDPFYNINLELTAETFRIRTALK